MVPRGPFSDVPGLHGKSLTPESSVPSSPESATISFRNPNAIRHDTKGRNSCEAGNIFDAISIMQP